MFINDACLTYLVKKTNCQKLENNFKLHNIVTTDQLLVVLE